MLFSTSVPLQSIDAKINVQCTVLVCSRGGEHQEKSLLTQCEFVERKCQHGCIGIFCFTNLDMHYSICPYKTGSVSSVTN